MKRETAKWIRKAEDDWAVTRELAAQEEPLRDATCFHCQQAVEKYLKALLQDRGEAIPKTHDLEVLLDLLLPLDSRLLPLRRGLRTLTRYAVEYRYPGQRATQRGMAAALRQAERIRLEVRTRLGLPP